MVGEEFITIFGSLTDADITASTNLTGSASLGGDWILEKKIGIINNSNLSFSNYSRLLTTVTFVTDSLEDKNQQSDRFTRDITATNTATFTFKAGSTITNSVSNGIDINSDYTTGGLYASSNRNSCMGVDLSIQASGNTFDITAFKVYMTTLGTGNPSDLTITYVKNGSTSSYTITPTPATYSLLSITGITALNDVSEVVLTSENFAFFQDIEITDIKDSNPPNISNVSSSNITATTADISLTSDEAGTSYYVVTTSSIVPTNTQVAQGYDNTSTAAIKSGNSTVSANTAKTFNISGLTQGTKYYYYIVSKDSSNNISTVSDGNFTTLVSSPSVQSITPAGSAQNSATETFTVTFSQAVTGVDISDFTLTKSGTA